VDTDNRNYQKYFCCSLTINALTCWQVRFHVMWLLVFHLIYTFGIEMNIVCVLILQWLINYVPWIQCLALI